MATNNRWHKIWSDRTIQMPCCLDVSLGSLIRANGFDTGTGTYREDQWVSLTADLIRRFHIDASSRIFEVGCGSGALLYSLYQHVGCSCSGIDYSASLISIAKRALPRGHFAAVDALAMEVFGPFDVVLSHSVFQYFPSHEYAMGVLLRMVDFVAPGGYIVLMDLNDDNFESSYHNQRRLSYPDPNKYDDDYRDLGHLFFNIDGVSDQLAALGFVDIKVFPHAVPEYGNARFRFNVSATKR